MVEAPIERRALVARLAVAGCVAPDEEAEELQAAAAGDPGRLARLLARRLNGEPLAWLTGRVSFAGHVVRVERGVYVPRWQSEPLARRAAARLPETGRAVDLCTGSGAVAVVLARARPRARVVATDLDLAACACAAANGVAVFAGHLDEPLPTDLVGTVDVVTAVAPYVPTEALALLPHDVLAYEPRRALDGGPGGAAVLEEAVWAANRLLRPGGWLLLELGADQDRALAPVLATAGFGEVELLADEDGDLRGLEARRATPAGPPPGGRTVGPSAGQPGGPAQSEWGSEAGNDSTSSSSSRSSKCPPSRSMAATVSSDSRSSTSEARESTASGGG